MVQHFFRQMQSKFEMSLVGELTYFLGLQVKQMDDTISTSQSKYAKSIVKKFGMEMASHKRTPIPTHLNLTKDEKGVNMDQSLYKSMLGSLLYLTASRPDITFAVGVCVRYQYESKMSHITQVKRILKYINGTSDYGMLYSHNANSLLTRYYDTYWPSSDDDRKITSEGCFFLSIPKTSKMSQPSVSTPSKHSKENSNPKNIGAEIDLSDVITDVIPLSIVLVHATPMRKARTSAYRKGKPSKVSTSSFPSMTARNVKTLRPSTAVKKP
ncbi:uncharacterized mitochondrial protein AtMg00810-like [Lathyrus oleraceus]|uniref:uncharacterized mitochondrial protein AtMg00810-like n=1 Tax=Pisum sativum TaxID=3888 RepID=UPI0021CF840F|nr:uncharacterized mitochondrial protein AtMg00810-like [Pisum sativum]